MALKFQILAWNRDKNVAESNLLIQRFNAKDCQCILYRLNYHGFNEKVQIRLHLWRGMDFLPMVRGSLESTDLYSPSLKFRTIGDVMISVVVCQTKDYLLFPTKHAALGRMSKLVCQNQDNVSAWSDVYVQTFVLSELELI